MKAHVHFKYNAFGCYEAKIEENEKASSWLFTFLYFRLITSKCIYFQREARCSEHFKYICTYIGSLFYPIPRVSGPIPGITPHIDSSVPGKFTVQARDGTVLSLNPKVIMEEDVAPPPVPGQPVQQVPRKEILKSQEQPESAL